MFKKYPKSKACHCCKQALYHSVFNGRTVGRLENYAGDHFNMTNNLSLLGWRLTGPAYKWSAFGALTDLQIWDRLLGEEEVEQWSRCELGAAGNLLDWNTAQWEVVGLQQFQMGKDEVFILNRLKDNTDVI